MAGTVRRTVRNWTPNDLRVDQARFYGLALVAKKMSRSPQSLLESAIDCLLSQQGLLVSAGSQLAPTCDLCKAVLTKATVSPWLLAAGIWGCGRCFTELVNVRESRIAAAKAQRLDEDRRRLRAANGGPVPIRPNPAITRG